MDAGWQEKEIMYRNNNLAIGNSGRMYVKGKKSAIMKTNYSFLKQFVVACAKEI